ncbi:glycosyl transferase family protein [Sphingomonas sp. 28-63-12]|uniref:glycosyl transferase family protein n=1 Tax=Sphingomonas sp. 28-63-12 TaxID=1970434 RepID=UPI0035A90F21
MIGWEASVALVDIVAREALLFAAIGIAVGGLDDLVVDLLFLAGCGWRRLTRRRANEPMLADFSAPEPQGRIAIFVAAWDESAVIGAMLTSALARLEFPDYQIYVGTYPNDLATIEAVARVAASDDRVRLVVGSVPGPTTKAANLNVLWQALVRDEVAGEVRARAIVLHDAEDLLHPYELKIFDRLIGPNLAVQLPVRPLVQAGSRFISGHYCDEFAEAHGKQLIVRAALGVGMPLAGVGCAIARAALAELAARRAGDPFDADSLTEDYELGLHLSALGGRVMFARIREYPGGPLVAIQAYFPAILDDAVRQKARWMIGIALAGWDRIGWGRRLDLGDHWMRMRDRRQPIAVLVLAAAYLALVATPLSWVGHWLLASPMAAAVIPPLVLLANGALLVWRLVMRVAFTAAAYGAREGLWSVPRALVGNIIALLAARRALLRYIAMLQGATLRWDKTAHVFPAVGPQPGS